MTAWRWFWLVCVIGFYLGSAYFYAQVPQSVISKNPLFIFSVIVLCGLVLAFRMEGFYKTVLLVILTFLLGIVFISNLLGM